MQFLFYFQNKIMNNLPTETVRVFQLHSLLGS